MKKLFLFLFLGIFLINSVFALSVTLSPTTISESIDQGESKFISIGYTINGINLTKDEGKYIWIYFDSNSGEFLEESIVQSSALISSSQNTGSVQLYFPVKDTTQKGDYEGVIRAKYGEDISNTVDVLINVEDDSTPNGECYLYTKNYFKSPKIKQGESNDNIATIKVVASSGCPNLNFDDITLTSTDAMEGEPLGISFMETSIEGKEYLFRLSANAENVQTGSYNYIYSISASGEGYENLNKDIEFVITVISGINPIADDLPSSLPTCSLSASEFELNKTYKLICTATNPNIYIHPIVDNRYIEGLGVTETGSSYEYLFNPKQFGNTEIKARFLFKNAPIGNEYSQEVRILAGSGVVPGTSLALRFYPELYIAKEDEPITIRAVDNESGNILTGATIYLDGIEMVNDSLILKSGKNYEIRASFIGYSDLVKTINLNPKLIDFTINSEYNLGDTLNFTTDPEDATVSLNGELINIPFVFTELGTFEISVSKLGYTTSSKNITIGSQANVIYSTPPSDTKKGGEILVEFEKNDTLIRVDFQADPREASNILVEEFIGKEVRFDTKKVGVYRIYADEQMVHQVSIVKGSSWWKSPWFWIPASLILIALFVYYGFLKEDSEEEEVS